MSVKVLIADDHQIMREGLCSLLEDIPDIVVAGMAGNGREALKKAIEIMPDVILMDVSMPEMSGIEAARAIREKLPRIRILALSMYSDRRYVEAMFKSGAIGYLLKDSAFEELERAIRSVAAGTPYLSAKIGQEIARDYFVKRAGFFDASPQTLTPLTPRENEILKLLTSGLKTKEVAEQLKVSTKTVETHRSRIMTKTHTKNIAELTKYAIREGLISPDE